MSIPVWRRFLRTLKQNIAGLLWRTRCYGLLRKIDPRVDLEVVRFADAVRSNFTASRAQQLQDIWVLFETAFRHGGYFVEFGAGDGRYFSNSWLLEKKFGWRGILAEPNPAWHTNLRKDRPLARLDFRAVYVRSGESLRFRGGSLRELGCLEVYSSPDSHSDALEGVSAISVQTVSLIDLLSAHGAPRLIDYMSIDTEGGELEILQGFDFSQYRIGLISVEHNFTPAREKIFALLTGLGYQRKFEEFSHQDDWYVLKSQAGG